MVGPVCHSADSDGDDRQSKSRLSGGGKKSAVPSESMLLQQLDCSHTLMDRNRARQRRLRHCGSGPTEQPRAGLGGRALTEERRGAQPNGTATEAMDGRPPPLEGERLNERPLERRHQFALGGPPLSLLGGFVGGSLLELCVNVSLTLHRVPTSCATEGPDWLGQL